MFVRRVAIVAMMLTLAAQSAFAAQLYFGTAAPTVGVNQLVEVGVFVDSQGQDINAVDGTISFPANLFTLKDIETGNSIIPFWVQTPTATSSSVSFSGIVPGGFTGGRGELFSMVFETNGTGNANITINNDHVLLNDGQGTAAKLSVAPLALSIQSTSKTPAFVQPADTTPPEPFTPTITRDPNEFDDQWFVVFSTVDKESGLDHFDVQESMDAQPSASNWKTATSPYVLQDQTGHSYTFIRAVDKAGNIRIETVPPTYPLAWYTKWQNWGIILLIVIAATVVAWHLWRKQKNKGEYSA